MKICRIQEFPRNKLGETSVLIDFLKNKSNDGTDKFNTILDLSIPFGITSHIYQELLQGTSSERDFNILKEYLDTFTFYYPKDNKQSFAEAAHIYFECRRKGITISSSVDCLVSQIAREHNLKFPF
ncbi:MAG: hypothetical protein K8F52_04905 [Candidatus Scalindua rubra]|uniref:PIN domain protein n=1 Tax=Candidatus Scalindua brodae TaxID=237368 RepID=A0A0B0EJ20_9BACT|nr:MAG: hypothetical protein SCABRO_01670 [Candidatus Scalindua brodae]MBZ0107986.1 hypothetical protein [Candidatus Scalindua rubra]TWU36440.1 hypothetical protein S225a_07190 [Candidatus Brocadiaceae bacterium S225]